MFLCCHECTALFGCDWWLSAASTPRPPDAQASRLRVLSAPVPPGPASLTVLVFCRGTDQNETGDPERWDPFFVGEAAIQEFKAALAAWRGRRRRDGCPSLAVAKLPAVSQYLHLQMIRAELLEAEDPF